MSHPAALELAPIVSIFDDADVFTRYRFTLQFRALVVGGIPQKPEIIESWLRTRILGGDIELATMLRKTLTDLDIEIPENATREEIIEAAKTMASARNGNTFYSNKNEGLFLCDYNVKAMIKEATSILFPYGPDNKWGPTRKAPRGLVAERVFIDEMHIPLGRTEPDGTLMQVGHVSGPRGPRSTLTYYDYCIQPAISFTIASAQDIVTADQWHKLFTLGQRLGLGAVRSMGHGQFAVRDFHQV